jgi:hypothetical protein
MMMGLWIVTCQGQLWGQGQPCFIVESLALSTAVFFSQSPKPQMFAGLYISNLICSRTVDLQSQQELVERWDCLAQKESEVLSSERHFRSSGKSDRQLLVLKDSIRWHLISGDDRKAQFLFSLFLSRLFPGLENNAPPSTSSSLQ